MELMIICGFFGRACGQPWSCRKVMLGQVVRACPNGVRCVDRVKKRVKKMLALVRQGFKARASWFSRTERSIENLCWRCWCLAPALAGCWARRCRDLLRGMRTGFRVPAAFHPQRFDRDAAALAGQARHGGRSCQRRWRLSGMAPPPGRPMRMRWQTARQAPGAFDHGNGGARPHRMRRHARHRRAR